MHLKLTDPNVEVTIVIPESNFESAKWILFFFFVLKLFWEGSLHILKNIFSLD